MTADGKTAQIKVIVFVQEDWMIKEVAIDGVKMDSFLTNTREYDFNLLMGTTKVPEITATSFNGATVDVTLPSSLPGNAELQVQGATEKYIIHIDNTLIEYGLNQNFDGFTIGTQIEAAADDTYYWDIRGNNASRRYIPYCLITPSNTIESGKEGNCLSFPYLYDLGTKNTTRLVIHDGYRYDFSVDQDMLLVIEMDFAVTNMAGKENGFDFSFHGLAEKDSLERMAWFNVTGNEFRRSINNNANSFNTESIQTIEENKFYTLRLVVDKQAQTMDYYLDDKLIEEGAAFFQNGVTNFSRIYLNNEVESAPSDASIFFDNFKTYELMRGVDDMLWPQESAQDDWMLQEITVDEVKLENFAADIKEYNVNLPLGTTQIPVITAVSVSGASVNVTLPESLPGDAELQVEGATEKYVIHIDNTVIEYGLNQDFESFELDTTIDEAINEQEYTWDIRKGSYKPYSTIIASNTIEEGKEGKCLSYPYIHDLGINNVLLLNEENRYSFSENQDRLLVVEMDFAVKNMTNKTNGFDVSFHAVADTDKVERIAWFNFTGNEIRRSINNSANTFSQASIQTIAENKFYTLRIVVDKEARTMSYYLNDMLVEEDVAFFKDDATGFGRIYFRCDAETETCDAAMYFDNIKAYEIMKGYEDTLWPQVAE